MSICEIGDVTVVAELSDLLLQCVADVLYKQRINLDSKEGTAKVQQQIREVLDKLTPQNSGVFQLVRECLTEFVRQRPRGLVGLVTALTSSDSQKEEAAQNLASKLREKDFWPARTVYARDLLIRLDSSGKDHCTRIFSSEAELRQHQATDCEFRPQVCSNVDCVVVVSARSIPLHDGACPHKLVDCPQKCGESIKRQQVQDHCQKGCEMRLIDCPFYGIGCPEQVPQRHINEHLNEFVHAHLLNCMKSITQLKTENRQYAEQAVLMQAEITGLLETQAKLVTQVAELEKTSKLTFRDVKNLKKEVEDAHRSVATVKQTSSKLLKNVSQIEKDIYEPASKS
eukprot:c2604_g1_i1.p1 GENE.c2604_g1_i1~~c2604_g1_i1.p1  ORF type:complete len:341 (+),score=66.55 c2604_g1_i1:44-1066(+)